MMIFHNPGLIDLDAVRTMGVSVKRPGSFGYFGTGLKFAIATILRGGGSITIWRGEAMHTIGTVTKEIRGEEFEIICLDDEQMGITNQLGRNWKPWMVLRELGCNARDEGGDFNLLPENEDERARAIDEHIGEDMTRIIVDWPDLDAAFAEQDTLFLDPDLPRIFESDDLEACDGESQFIFYRGVRVYKLPRKSRLTYNLLSDQYLTEDRSLIGHHSLDEALRDYLLADAEQELIEMLITGEGQYEPEIDFKSHSQEPSRAFLDAALEVRQRGDLESASIRGILMKAMRQGTLIGGSVGGASSMTSGALGTVLKSLRGLGIKIDTEKTPIVVIDELPADMQSLAENDRIYILPELLEGSLYNLAFELLLRWIDLQAPYGSAREAAQLLADPLFRRDPILATARDSDEQAAPEIDSGLPRVTIDDDEVAPFDQPAEA